LYPLPEFGELLAAARENRYKTIEVFTNGTLLEDGHLDCFAANGVRVAVSIYSSRPSVHDAVTRRPGSFQRLRRAMERLVERGIPLRAGLVVMEANAATEHETLEWAAVNFPSVPVRTDLCRSTANGRGASAGLLPPSILHRRLRTAPLFPPVPAADFRRRLGGESCLSRSLCVHSDGGVYPCIMDRIHLLGDARQASLLEIIRGGAARGLRSSARDRIPACRDCEFRYACPLCPPLTAALGGRGADRDPLCLYNPYEGVWDAPDASAACV
jgi:radical SAM protein with 4Fe4S-binding SPASM domain